MNELERLEQSLFFHYAILQELIDIAFVDLCDFIETKTIKDKHGNERRELVLKDGVQPHSGVEIIIHRDGFTVRAPYRMRALDMLAKYFDVLGTQRVENDMKSKIQLEMEKTKRAMEMLKQDSEHNRLNEG